MGRDGDIASSTEPGSLNFGQVYSCGGLLDLLSIGLVTGLGVVSGK